MVGPLSTVGNEERVAKEFYMMMFVGGGAPTRRTGRTLDAVEV